MTIPTEVLVRMATLGLSADQARAVGEMLSAVEGATKAESEKVIEDGREKGRARWRRWKENHSNVSEHEQTLANADKHSRAGDTRGLDKTSIQRIEPQEDKKTSRAQSDVAAFKSALAGDVDPVTLDEFVKVRRKKRGALTGFAANLFREDALACSLTPQQAARECVRSSWITVKPEYFASRQRAGPSLDRPKTPASVAADILRKMELSDADTPAKIEGRGAPVISIPFQRFG